VFVVDDPDTVGENVIKMISSGPKDIKGSFENQKVIEKEIKVGVLMAKERPHLVSYSEKFKKKEGEKKGKRRRKEEEKEKKEGKKEEKRTGKEEEKRAREGQKKEKRRGKRGKKEGEKKGKRRRRGKGRKGNIKYIFWFILIVKNFIISKTMLL
jgi:hypothetical protein